MLTQWGISPTVKEGFDYVNFLFVSRGSFSGYSEIKNYKIRRVFPTFANDRRKDSMNTRHRKLFNALWLVAAILVNSASAQEANKSKSDQASAVVRIDSGQLQGVDGDGVISFKGIPFAAPPVGELRWRPPQPTPKWTGVRQAAEFGPSCMQGRGFGPPPPRAPASGAPAAAAPAPVAAPAAQEPSEDCLYLSVWRPSNPVARNLPVMVWIYGGGFVGGSSSSPITSGVQFAKQGVSLSHELSSWTFGFFAFPALSSDPLMRTRATARTWTSLPPCSGCGISPPSGVIRTTSPSLGSRRAMSPSGMLASPGARIVPQGHRDSADRGQRTHRPADAC